jgi:hypothetical protein
MKWDRVAVALIVLGQLAALNFLPTNLPQVDRYGRGFPMKWEYDPAYQHSPFARKSKYGPRDGWRFEGWALAADVVFGLAALGLLLGWNEIYQRSRGNRPDPDPR